MGGPHGTPPRSNSTGPMNKMAGPVAGQQQQQDAPHSRPTSHHGSPHSQRSMQSHDRSHDPRGGAGSLEGGGGGPRMGAGTVGDKDQVRMERPKGAGMGGRGGGRQQGHQS